MRRLSYLLLILVIILAPGFTCRKEHPCTPATLKGKLIINAGCGIYAIQVLEGNIDPDKVTASWKNPANDSTYAQVFTVANVCTFGGNHLSKGDVFNFELDADPSPQNCAVCYLYYPTPPAKNAVKNVQKIK